MDFKERSSIKTTVAAAISGFATRSLTHPFDIVKINFQLQKMPISKDSKLSRFQGLVQAFTQLYKEQGVRGFVVGHNAGQFLSISYTVTQFTTYEYMTKILLERIPKVSKEKVAFCSGYLSGTFATLVSYPFDTARTRLIAQWPEKTYMNAFHCISKVTRENGLGTLYKGLLPAVIQVGPYSGSMFLTHYIISAALKKTNTLTNSDNELTPSGNLLAGSTAGFVGKSVIYPLDLTRHRMQSIGMIAHGSFICDKYNCRNMIELIMQTVKVEGVMALFKGYIPSVIKASVTSSLYFTFYAEACKRLDM